MNDGGWGKRYARTRQMQREAGRRVASDVEGNMRTRAFVNLFGIACKQTGGDIKGALALMAQWKEAEKKELAND